MTPDNKSNPGTATGEPESNLPVWDRQTALDRLDGDSGLLDMVVDTYREELPRLVAGLRDALRTGDADAARVHAHSIKGAAATVGGARLRAVAARMEQAARIDDVAGAAVCMPALEAEFERLCIAMAEGFAAAPPLARVA
jgi:HPt (histidine-containing phosphotransfer) domain-containing protein